MRHLPVSASLALGLLLLAGCSSPAADADAPPADDRPRPQEIKGSGGSGGDDNRTRAPLGHVSGGPSLMTRIPFQVTVPPGNATAVTWQLRVNVFAILGHVEGEGCPFGASYYGTYIVGNYAIMYGDCPHLAAGTYAFEAVLEHPVPDYDAMVLGDVLKARPTAGNATAQA